MIPANELRLGNWVKEGRGNPVTVKEIFKEGDKVFITFLFEFGSKFTAQPHNLEPITLTPEILEKAGFEKLPNYTFQPSMNIRIGRMRAISIVGAGTPDEMVFLTYEIDHKTKSVIVLSSFAYDGNIYLHQLQNLYFAVTGEELEINLINSVQYSQ